MEATLVGWAGLGVAAVSLAVLVFALVRLARASRATAPAEA